MSVIELINKLEELGMDDSRIHRIVMAMIRENRVYVEYECVKVDD